MTSHPAIPRQDEVSATSEPSTLRKAAFSFCIFLALAFLAEAAGHAAHELNAVLGIGLLLCGVLALPRAPRIVPRPRHALLRGLQLGAFLLLGFPGAARLMAVALWLGVLAIDGAPDGVRARMLRSAALGSAIFALFQLATRVCLAAWYGERGASEALSSMWGMTFGVPLVVGPSLSGLTLIAIFVFLRLAALREHRIPLRWGELGLLAVVGLLQGLYLRMFAGLARVQNPTRADGISDVLVGKLLDAFPLQMPLLLCIALGVLYASRAARLAIPVATAWPRSAFTRVMGPLSATAVVLAIILAFDRVPAFDGVPRTIAIYEKGLTNWSKPVSGFYGDYSVGMSGMLPDLVKAMGWTPRRISELTDENLDGCDALYMMNQDELFPEETLACIRRFIVSGAGLVLLGDHTCWRHGKNVLNEPLDGTDIAFRFDNAEFFVPGWLHSYRYWPQRIFAGLDDRRNDAGTVVGASLDITYPAVPLLVGRFGWSDAGNPMAESIGYMGDRKFQPGERAGDQVLVAAQTLGRGRLLVFGDTTAFANGFLPRTWDVVSRSLRFVADRSASLPGVASDLAVLVLLVSAAAMLVVSVSGTPGNLPVWAFTSLLLLVLAERTLADRSKPPPLRGIAPAENERPRPLAIFDASHYGVESSENIRKNGLGSLTITLYREGFFPIVARGLESEQLAEAKLVTLIAPARPIGADHAARLLRWVEDGGSLFVAAGYQDRIAVESLLAPLGLAIQPVPLGASAGTWPGKPYRPTFWSAWEVAGGEPLVTIDGRNVAVEVRRGRGRVLFVGDSEHFRNKNLELEDDAVPQNAAFLKDLLGRLAGV